MDEITVSVPTILFIIAWVVGLLAAGKIKYFPLIVFITAWLLAGASTAMEGDIFVDQLFKYIFLLCVGIQGIWAFIGHCFCSKSTAKHMGWKHSEFQHQVGVVNLSLGLLGILAFWFSCLWMAGVLVVSTYYIGSAIIHIRESIQNSNNQPGNVGPVLYTDIFVPATLILALIYKASVFGCY